MSNYNDSMRIGQEDRQCTEKRKDSTANLDSPVDSRFESCRSVDRFSSLSLCLSTTVGLVVFISYLFQRRKLGNQKTKQASKQQSDSKILCRKREFLDRAGDDYGYSTSPAGHIDEWRSKEYPRLVSPLGKSTNEPEEAEVYLDYAGAALPSQSQLQKCFESTASILLANPHSTGPAASRTLLQIQQSTKRVLDHFDGQPGRFAGMSSPPPFAADPRESHVGYELVWTSGTTEALRIVAERFPFAHCKTCGRQSNLVYSQNSHTSVVGMRAPALAKGGTFLCLPLSEIVNATPETIRTWGEGERQTEECNVCRGKTRNLIVLPGECNFGGDRADVKFLIETVRCLSSDQSEWFVMLDLAKAASTGPVNLKRLDPDFACISFYKMFGEPTGLGSLFVKRSSVDILMGDPEANPNSSSHYFGGGSVDAILPRIEFAVPRSEPSLLASLSHGTPHFRGIASLVHGFGELERIGGSESIMIHTKSLTRELTRRFRALRHGNGRPAVVIYGAWAGVRLDESLDLLPGPIVPFNVLRSDGSFVGYNEVSKLAALNRPPLQMRTGCVCNPGACQEALELSDNDVQRNYFTSGHVCGDQIDILNDKPTGAVRASFGKDSLWEDMDALVEFIERIFVNKVSHVQNGPLGVQVRTSVEAKAVLSEIYIFPIKSCAAQRVTTRWSLMVDSGRLAFDREFALVDSTGSAMRLQAYPRMSQIRPVIDVSQRTMTVTAPGMQPLVLQLDGSSSADEPAGHESAHSSIVKVCGNRCGGRLWGDYEASDWFSNFLGVQCWLARHSGRTYQLSPSALLLGTLRPPEIAFANEAPILLVSESSVETLNQHLSSQDQQMVQPRHFRPNFVVRMGGLGQDSTHATNPEDSWSRLTHEDNSIVLDVVGQCARCAMVDVDPDSGTKGKTLRALADYRRKSGQIMFGVFLKVGDAKSNSFVVVKEGDAWVCSGS